MVTPRSGRHFITRLFFFCRTLLFSFCSVLSDYLQKRNNSVPKSGKITFFFNHFAFNFFQILTCSVASCFYLFIKRTIQTKVFGPSTHFNSRNFFMASVPTSQLSQLLFLWKGFLYVLHFRIVCGKFWSFIKTSACETRH